MLTENRTWFITGINRGLGRHLAQQVLENGERVAGTARDLSQLEDLKQQHGDRLWLGQLDLTDTPGIRSILARAFENFGQVDVVVSNAGYSLLGAAEELNDQDIQHILDTNLVGSIQLARAAVPLLRAQGGGRIVQISSSSAQVSFPGLSLYCASKWGIEGFFESLSQEVRDFGIETTLVEPGAIRTSFATSGVVSPALAIYKDTPVRLFREMLDSGFEAGGDPARMATAIIASLETVPAPSRLVLGSDAYTMITEALRGRLERVEKQRKVAYSTDFEMQPT
jgi:NAD(P)-dependent dehydrogenase (short-subunit alcohol dehydrogenase family)